MTRFVSVVDKLVSSDELLSLPLGFDNFLGALLGFDNASCSLPSLLFRFDEVPNVLFCCSLFVCCFSSFYSFFVHLFDLFNRNILINNRWFH